MMRNNKPLLWLFFGLLALTGLIFFFLDKGERTFKPEIIQVDSTKVTSIVLHAKADSLSEVVLEKKETGWTVSKAGKTFPAEMEAVQNLLVNLALVKTSYIAAKSKDKWAEFELEENKASRVTVLAGKKVLADFFVGKFNFNQAQQQVTTYFRLADRDDVYGVDGMAGLGFGQGFAAYRNKQVLAFGVHAVESLKYENSPSYEVSKTANGWLLNGSEPLDSNKVRDFLLNLRQMSGDEFVQNFDPEKESGKLFKTLTISGKAMPEPVVVRCWRDTTRAKPFVIQSSQFPDAFFASDTSRVFKRIFKPVREW